jgi:hypothetical protein
MSDCPYCPILQTEVNRLQVENKRLADRVKRLIAWLEHLSNECQKIEDRCDGILSGHAPRGKWSFAKGARAVAFVIKRFIAQALAG